MMRSHHLEDDDIRDMLHARAAEATVSPDAWDSIAARLAGTRRPQLGRRLAVAGVAAAAVAATVVVANLPESDSKVAAPSTAVTSTTATVPVAPPATTAPSDPATPTGSRIAVWPAVDSVGLAALQADADAGRRPDLLDPRAVAGGFLGELLPRDESPTSFAVGRFQQGDANSGEVPYTLAGAAGGTVLVRTTGEPGAIWYVVGATSASLHIVDTRREETHLVADVRSTMNGTLTWSGAPPVRVIGGPDAFSIGRPDTPIGGYPVVVRLVDGGRTLALAATLG